MFAVYKIIYRASFVVDYLLRYPLIVHDRLFSGSVVQCIHEIVQPIIK